MKPDENHTPGGDVCEGSGTPAPCGDFRGTDSVRPNTSAREVKNQINLLAPMLYQAMHDTE
jgi:hypothetical protein